jgi:hypothetical protein
MAAIPPDQARKLMLRDGDAQEAHCEGSIQHQGLYS